MTVASVTILAPPDGFDTYDLRPGIDMAWTGGVGPFDVRYEWDDNISFPSPIIVTNIGVTSPDSAVPTSDMGPPGTDWFFRVTVIDNDDAGELQEPVGSHRTLNFQDADDDFRYLYVNHNIGVGFGVDSFDSLPLGDGEASDFSRYLYLNHNVTADQPCPWLEFITPTLQLQGGTVTLFGDSFGAVQATYTTEIRLYDEQGDFAGAHVLMSATSWSDTEVSVTVPSGATSGFIAVVHTNVGATCDGSAFKALTVIQTEADPQMGWWIQTADKENQVTADATILPNNVMSASFKKIMNAVGSGVIEIPLAEPDIDSIIDPLMRKGVLNRCYIDDRFRYAFFGEKLSHAIDDDGNAVARIVGRGMEAVAMWTKLLPHDAPASPSLSPTWIYGSTENLIRNPGFDDVVDNPILVNPDGEDGNDDDGNAVGWSARGDDVTSIAGVEDSLGARSGDWYINVDVSDNHSGMTQSIPVAPNRVVHVQAFVQDTTAAGMRVTLALGGADDIAATATFPNNFEFGNEILAELDNVASNGLGTPGGSTDGTYQVLDVEVLTGAEQTSLTVTVQNDHHLTGVFVPFRVDDVTIDGWGLGLEPWEAYDAANHAAGSFRLSTTHTKDSSTYALLLDLDKNGPGVQQKVAVNPSTKYTLTTHLYPTGTSDSWALAIVKSDGVLVRDFTPIVPTADVFNEVELIYTTASDETEIFVRFTYEGTTVPDPTDAWLDSFKLVPGEPASFAGKIVNDVLDAMATAGKLTYLQRTFTDTVDSNGVNFPAKLSMDLEPAESLYGLLQRLVALGHEWEIVPVNFRAGGDTGMELNLYTARSFDPASGIGVSQISDEDGTVITPGDGVEDGRIIKTAFNVNTVFALGTGGVWSQAEQFPYETVDIPAGDPAPAGYKESFGIIEDVVTVPGSDSETVAEYAGGRLSEEKGKERSIKIEMQRDADIRPFLDFAVGDSLFVDMPPHNADPLDATTGLRAYPKRVRAIKATLPPTGIIRYSIDIDRVVHEDELGWRALIAQLMERAPSDNVGQGFGTVSVPVVTAPVPPGTAPHQHDLGSSDVTNKTLTGDVSGTLPGPVTVNRVKGQPMSGTIPAISRVLDPHRVTRLYDRDLKQWAPTELLDRNEGFFNGTFLEHVRTAISEAAGVVTLAVDQAGGGDLTMRFSDGNTTFDTTPAATIELTVGTDAILQMNYIFIPQATKVLTKSTSGYPTTTEHIRVATFYVQSAANVQTRGGTVVHQIWNDGATEPSGQGHGPKVWEHLRRTRAQFFSGFDGAGTSEYLTLAGTTVDFKVTSGVVYQLHDHLVDAHDTSTGEAMLVKNWSGDPFHQVTNLFDIVDLSDGTTIGNNKWFKFVVWGVVSGGDFHPYMINVPSGFYNTQSGAEADLNGFSDFDIPREFTLDSTTGFLIAAITVKKQASAWVFGSTQDIRGQLPAVAASGGATAGISQFSDSIFHVFSNADSTKVVELDVSGVPTGTTVTLAVPAADGTIATQAYANGLDHDHATPIAAHAGDDDAHHVKYLDSEAAAKVASDDLYVQADGDTMRDALSMGRNALTDVVSIDDDVKPRMVIGPSGTVIARAELLMRARNYAGSGDFLDESGNGHDGVITGAKFLPYTGRKYAFHPGAVGDYFFVPDHNSLDVTNIDVRILLRWDEATPAATDYIAAKGDNGTLKSWHIVRNTLGQFIIRVTPDGTGASEVTVPHASGTAAVISDGDLAAFRFTFDSDNGAGDCDFNVFYKVSESLTHADVESDTGWTQLGATANGGTTVAPFNSSVGFSWSSFQNIAPGPTGDHFVMIQKDDIDGITVLDIDLNDPTVVRPHATFTDVTGTHTVTVNRSGSGQTLTIVDEPMFLFDGIDDMIVAADDDGLDFGLSDSLTAIIVASYPATHSAFLFGKKSFSESSVGYGLAMINGAVWGNVADGAGNGADSGGAADVGEIFVHTLVRNTVDDDYEVFLDGVGSGSPVADGTTGTLANALDLHIGSTPNPNQFFRGQILAVGLWREALTNAEVLSVIPELTNPADDIEWRKRDGTTPAFRYNQRQNIVEAVNVDGFGVPVRVITGDPANPTEGQMIVNTSDNKVRVFADGAWRDLATW